MRLFIMRHGPAEGSAPSGRDFDRPLSEAGKATVTAVAKQLASRGDSPERILSSPLVRAVETAKLVAWVLHRDEGVEIHGELSPSEDSTGLVRTLVAQAARSVLVVSHAPDVSILAASLLGEEPSSFPTAMVLALDVTPTGATRRFVISP